MFRAVLDSVLLYPCDAVSTERSSRKPPGHRGLVYLRTSRKPRR